MNKNWIYVVLCAVFAFFGLAFAAPTLASAQNGYATDGHAGPWTPPGRELLHGGQSVPFFVGDGAHPFDDVSSLVNDPEGVECLRLACLAASLDVNDPQHQNYADGISSCRQAQKERLARVFPKPDKDHAGQKTGRTGRYLRPWWVGIKIQTADQALVCPTQKISRPRTAEDDERDKPRVLKVACDPDTDAYDDLTSIEGDPVPDAQVKKAPARKPAASSKAPVVKQPRPAVSGRAASKSPTPLAEKAPRASLPVSGGSACDAFEIIESESKDTDLSVRVKESGAWQGDVRACFGKSHDTRAVSVFPTTKWQGSIGFCHHASGGTWDIDPHVADKDFLKGNPLARGEPANTKFMQDCVGKDGKAGQFGLVLNPGARFELKKLAAGASNPDSGPFLLLPKSAVPFVSASSAASKRTAEVTSGSAKRPSVPSPDVVAAPRAPIGGTAVVAPPDSKKPSGGQPSSAGPTGSEKPASPQAPALSSSPILQPPPVIPPPQNPIDPKGFQIPGAPRAPSITPSVPPPPNRIFAPPPARKQSVPGSPEPGDPRFQNQDGDGNLDSEPQHARRGFRWRLRLPRSMFV